MRSRLAIFLELALALTAVVHASPLGDYSLNSTNVPTVKLDSAVVIGNTTGVVTSYLGIPFAQPPYVLVPLTRNCR